MRYETSAIVRGPPPRGSRSSLGDRLHILLRLDQGTEERYLLGDVTGLDARRQQRPDPIDELRGRGPLAQPLDLAQPVELRKALLEQLVTDLRVVNADDGGHEFCVRKLDEVEDATSEKGIGQLLFGVGGDDDHRTVGCLVAVTGLGHRELHDVELVQQIVGKLEVCLVDLVDQEHHLMLAGECPAKGAEPDVLADVGHVVVTEAAVLQPLHRVVDIEAISRLGGRLDVPGDQLELEILRHRRRQQRLACPRFAANQKRPLRSGRAALKHRVEKLGYKLTKAKLDHLYEEFLDVADKKKEVNDEDLKVLVGKEKRGPRNIEVETLQVTCGLNSIPTATVGLNIQGESLLETAIGNGPIDAAFTAVKKMVNKKVRLEEFLIQAITRGSEDMGKVHVQVQHKGGTYYGFSANTDIVTASVEAFIDALAQIV